MVTFNELRITPDGNTLIIDVAIKDLRYYDNVGLDTILIDTQDTFTAEGPSSKVVKFPVINSIDAESFEIEFGDTYDFKGTLKEGFLYTFKVPDRTGEYYISGELYSANKLETGVHKYEKGKLVAVTTPIKSYRIEINKNDSTLTFKDNLLFVYVKTNGTPASDTPCGMDEETTLGVTLYHYPIYNAMMNSIKELEKNCEVPKNFINSILRFKAFELAIDTEHYNQAIIYYNKFIKNINLNTVISNKCNCYG
ncbi:MAG TPA: hypothetical protein VFC79_03180 [Tissierellaceae bacterium]|nr:hypothetical protein [Tissierellaceae bacterium]